MDEGLLHGSSPAGECIDDVPGGIVEGEAVETGAVLEDGDLPGAEGGGYSEVVEAGLVLEVGEERGEDLDGADKGAEVRGGAESVGEVVEEGGACKVEDGVGCGCCVDGDAADVHGEVGVCGEGGKGGELVAGALCMAGGVLDAGVEGRDCACEECAADEGGGDEIRAVEAGKDELEHVQIDVHGQAGSVT